MCSWARINEVMLLCEETININVIEFIKEKVVTSLRYQARHRHRILAKLGSFSIKFVTKKDTSLKLYNSWDHGGICVRSRWCWKSALEFCELRAFSPLLTIKYEQINKNISTTLTLTTFSIRNLRYKFSAWQDSSFNCSKFSYLCLSRPLRYHPLFTRIPNPIRSEFNFVAGPLGPQ